MKALDHPGGPNVITRALKSGEEGRRKHQRRSDYRQVVRKMQCAGFEDGGRGHEPLKARKGKKTDSLLEPLERHAALPTP